MVGKCIVRAVCMLGLCGAGATACAGKDPANSETGGTGGAAETGGAAGAGGAAETGGAAGEANDAGTGGTAGSAEAGNIEGGMGEGDGAAGSSADDTKLFVPDIPHKYNGSVTEPGMEIIAHTIRKGNVLGYEWLVAIKNTSTNFICAVDMTSSFLDAAGNEVASGFSIVKTPLQRGNSGQGGFVQCLGPGQIGMVDDTQSLFDVEDVSVIASVNYSFGAIILVDAVPTNEIVVSGVHLVKDAFGRNQFAGQITNNSNEQVKNPSVAIFGVNSVGRPLLQGEDIELTTIPPGGSWSFTAGAFDEEIDDFMAFPVVHSL